MNSTASMRLWLGRPEPFTNETFSSWFRRLAEANGLTTAELYRVALPSAYLHSQDLDRLACPDLIGELAARTGVPVERIRSLTMARWCGRVFDEDDGRCKLFWLPPAGTDKAKQSFGQQYCPYCLAEDADPYFRQEWRFRFVTACPRHGRVLCDRCPKCASPIYPLKVARKRQALCCHKCGADLARAASASVDDLDIAGQTNLLRVAEDGWAELAEYGPVHALAFFQLLATLFRLLAGGSLARSLRAQVSMTAREGIDAAQIRVVKEAQQVLPDQRLLLLRWVNRLLESWPRRFVQACQAVGAYQSDLIKDPARTPFAFWEPVTRSLSAPSRRVEAAEFLHGKEFLRKQGVIPTYGALSRLFDNTLAAQKHLADPPSQTPRCHGRYWRLDNVDPDIRLAVIATAHRDGESLTAWVEKALRRELHQSKCVIASSE